MANRNQYSELIVDVPAKSYPVIIGNGLLFDHALLRKQVKAGQVMIITNTTVAPLYLSRVRQAFTDRQCDTLILEDGEAFKNQDSLNQIYDALLKNHHHRDTTLIALGGGVIGDITGFAAATYQRGTGFVQLPTTLLAQVDASVGGKTAINHPLGKNMIGCFYQPDAVIIDLQTLETLPLREFRAGIAEIIKYALLEGGEFFNLLYQALSQGLADNQSADLPAIIRECCRIKARFVKEDERESGSRALLNLGHTVGHALETESQYKRWLHGEAVAIGLYCAALLSYESQCLEWSDVELIDKLLHMAKLPSRIPKTSDLKAIEALMAQDKKIKNNKLRFILIKAMGSCYVEENLTNLSLQTVLTRALEGE